MLVLLSFLISRLIIRSGLRISHSKVFSSVYISKIKLIMHFCIQVYNFTLHRWKLQNRIPLMPIAKSLYPLRTLLILFLILSFRYPCWVPTNKSSLIDCGKNFKISQILIGCLISTIDTLIGCILDTFLDILDYVNLQINEKRRSNIDLDIHNYKV